jgi:hypothetical protein
MDGQPRLAIACDRQFLIQSVSSSGGGGYVFASEFDMKNGSSSKKMGGWWYEVSMNYANRSVLFVRDVPYCVVFHDLRNQAAGRMNGGGIEPVCQPTSSVFAHNTASNSVGVRKAVQSQICTDRLVCFYFVDTPIKFTQHTHIINAQLPLQLYECPT